MDRYHFIVTLFENDVIRVNLHVNPTPFVEGVFQLAHGFNELDLAIRRSILRLF